MPGQKGVLPGRNMGPLSPDFSIDFLNDDALQLPTAHAGSLALPELPPLIKDKALLKLSLPLLLQVLSAVPLLRCT